MKDENEVTERGENYLFGHSDDYIVDGLDQGGATRYINHSATDPNVEARVIFTNGGEKRIAFFALKYINAGQEVSFSFFPSRRRNYGIMDFVDLTVNEHNTSRFVRLAHLFISHFVPPAF